MLLNGLVSIGFSEEEAQRLAESNDFHHRRKTSLELKSLFDKISGVYECSFEDVKRSVLSFPAFASLDHERAVRQGVEVYGDEERVKRAMLMHPPFAGYNHERVVRQGVEVYGDEERVKRAMLMHPQFAGLDHERVVRQKERLGKIAGLTNEETIDYILYNPVLASYSAKRYLAAFDIGRQLEREGFPQDERMLKAFLMYYSKSPYVPDSNRKRISQVVSDKEPPLLIVMRKRLERRFRPC